LRRPHPRTGQTPCHSCPCQSTLPPARQARRGSMQRKELGGVSRAAQMQTPTGLACAHHQSEAAAPHRAAVAQPLHKHSSQTVRVGGTGPMSAQHQALLHPQHSTTKRSTA
jgi:hypothetical protein